MLNILLKPLLFISISIALIIPAQAQKKVYEPEKTFSAALLKEDFLFMRNALEEGHPTLYWYTAKDEMDQVFEETFSKIGGDMTEREYLQLLMPLIEKIHCAHTMIQPSKAYARHLDKKAGLLPLDLWIDPDYNLFVKQYKGTDSLVQKGDQLLSINDIPAEQLSRKFVDLTQVDGYTQTAKFRYAEGRFYYYMNLYVGEPDTFKVKVVRNAVDTLMLKLPSLTKKEQATIKEDRQEKLKEQASHEQSKAESLSGVKLYAKGKNEFRLIAHDSVKTGYLLIRSFNEKGFNKLYRKTFRWLEENQLDNLIIDLRGNKGGSSDAASNLMRYLSAEEFPYYKSIIMKKRNYSFNKELDSKFDRFFFAKLRRKCKNREGTYSLRNVDTLLKPKKLHFDKDVYVLTDGFTGSASSLFSANMQYQKKAIFIGEETGGGYYGCAGMISPNLTLPVTKLRLRLPMMQVLIAVDDQEPGRGIIPDHEVTADFESFVKGVDKQLLYTLKLISTKKNISLSPPATDR